MSVYTVLQLILNNINKGFIHDMFVGWEYAIGKDVNIWKPNLKSIFKQYITIKKLNFF
jgi:hypothetical protein